MFRRHWYILLILLILTGCGFASKRVAPRNIFQRIVEVFTGNSQEQGEKETAATDQASATLWPLSFSSVPFILSGGVILFLSSGRKGWWPLGVGVGLVLVNYVLVLLAGMIWVWGSILIGIVSLFGSYLLIRRYTTKYGRRKVPRKTFDSQFSPKTGRGGYTDGDLSKIESL